MYVPSNQLANTDVIPQSPERPPLSVFSTWANPLSEQARLLYTAIAARLMHH